MSKKRGNKKNLNLDNDSVDDLNVIKPESDKNNLTSKSAKAKAPKKGKKGKKDDDWSGDEDSKTPSLLNNVEEEIEPVGKKNTKKSEHICYDTGMKQGNTLQSDNFYFIVESKKHEQAESDDEEVSIAKTEQPAKKKGGKKGKNKNDDDWSDKDSDVELKLSVSEEEGDIIKPVKKSKKNAKNKKQEKHSDEEENGIEEPKVESTDKAETALEEVTEKVSELNIEDTKKEPEEKKLTHKEKKKLKKQQEYEKQMETLLKKGGQGHSDLDSNFTVTQAQKSANQLAHFENAVDIKVENFGISAKGNDLFVNANLLIAQGRHYGLVGPNG